MKTLIREGNFSTKVVTFSDLQDLITKVTSSTFARVSYTNNGAHGREHTWYPIICLKDSKCDFKFEVEQKY